MEHDNNKQLMSVQRLQTRGLSEAEARDRLAAYGPNELKSVQRFRLTRLLLAQFTNMFLILLMFASGVSWLTGARTDALIIGGIVLINAAISFIQEYRAEQAIKVLQRMMRPVTQVMRDGVLQKILVRLVVPGDVVRVEAGDHVPADGFVLESINGMVNEAALTGESVPVGKTAAASLQEAAEEQSAWAGTTVSAGRLTVVVTDTGMKTRLGNIARLTAEVGTEKSPLQEELDRIGRRIARLAAVICLAVFFIMLARQGWNLAAVRHAFLFAIALAVAIVPEGLPATVTIGLTLGMQKMAGLGAVIRKLSAVETLGCTTVICTDKTGTITRNEMKVRTLYASGDAVDITLDEDLVGSPTLAPDHQELLTLAVLCNNAEISGGTSLGDPTEIALLRAAQDAGVDLQALRRDRPRIQELPFDSVRRMMTTVHADGRHPGTDTRVITKGAPDRVLRQCTHLLKDNQAVPLNTVLNQELQHLHAGMAARGLRILAVARRDLRGDSPASAADVENNLAFVGLIGMADPPRPGVTEALDLCQRAGIRVIMITGDQRETALAVARETGIARGEADQVVTGDELRLLDDTALPAVTARVHIFAQIAPEDKLRIVEGLKQAGEVVAMTGDGVNDAPALKRADIGIAMGRAGTDIAKEASKMVVTDDSFATIVTAVTEGRAIYDNVRKFVLYAFSGITAEFLVVCFSLLPGVGSLLSAIQILWIDLGTEVLPALALSLDAPDADLMSRKPRKRGGHLIDRRLLVHILFNSLVIAAGAIGLNLAYRLAGREAQAQSLPFVAIILFQMVNVFNCRRPEQTIFTKAFHWNIPLMGAVAISVITTVLLVTLPVTARLFGLAPLGPGDWLITGLTAMLMIAAGEGFKHARDVVATRS